MHTITLNEHEFSYLIFALGVATGFRADNREWVEEMLGLMMAVQRKPFEGQRTVQGIS